MNEIELAKYIYDSAPLNNDRNLNEIKEKIELLSISQRLNFLVFSFQNYDINHNKELCLAHTNLWNNFDEIHWKKMILEMFQRKLKFEERDLKDINTGLYFSVFLLNEIIGVSPFDYIFKDASINEIEKEYFVNYLKFYGEVFLNYNERELIGDIVDFYDLNAFIDIVKMKENLLENSIFEQKISYSDLVIRYLTEYE